MIENEFDRLDKMLDELKEEGYKTFRKRERTRQFKRALAEYESKLNNPYEY